MSSSLKYFVLSRLCFFSLGVSICKPDFFFEKHSLPRTFPLFFFFCHQSVGETLPNLVPWAMGAWGPFVGTCWWLSVEASSVTPRQCVDLWPRCAGCHLSVMRPPVHVAWSSPCPRLPLPPGPDLSPISPSWLTCFTSLLLSSVQSSVWAVRTLALHYFDPSVGTLILRFSAMSPVFPTGLWCFWTFTKLWASRKERGKRCFWTVIQTLHKNAVRNQSHRSIDRGILTSSKHTEIKLLRNAMRKSFFRVLFN